MHRRPTIMAALAGTAVLLTAGAAGAAAPAAGPKVSVRVEGAARTLLSTTTVQVPGSGSITKAGAPAGSCPADSGAGALNVATKGRWGGSFSTKYNDYLVTQVLGDTESGTKAYWEVLVNNVAAQTGVCEIKLHAGDRLLFAAVSVKAKGYPAAITAPAKASAGKAFAVKVVYDNAKGHAVPLAGATVTGGDAKATTNARGVAAVTEAHAGTITLRAFKRGYVRAMPVSVRVRGT